MKRTLISLGITGLLSASALPAHAMDLLQAYKDAVASDAQYAVARATASAGREKRDQGLSTVLPQVDATASVFRNDADFETGTGVASSLEYDTTDWQLRLTQPLFRWQNVMSYQQGELQGAQAEANLVLAQQDLILRVVEAYFNVLFEQANLRATESQKTAITQQLELAKKSFEVGTATITDTYEAQARFDLVTAQEAAAVNAVEVARHRLALLLGKDPGELAKLRPDPPLNGPQPADMKAWLDQAEKSNIQVRIQELSAQVAGKSAEAARAGHYPTLDLVASYGQNNNDLYRSSAVNAWQTRILRYGLQLNVPLYAGGGTESRSREAAFQRDAALSGLENARRTAILGARQSYLGVVNGLAQVRALQAAVTSSQAALEATKVGYEVGIRINIDVLNAEQQLYATQRDLYKAALDTLLAHVRLKYAVGNLGEEDVRQINAILVN